MNQGMVQALILYTGTYFFELSPNQITVLFAASASGVMLGSALTRPLSNIVRQKKHLYMLGHCWYALFTTYVIILRLLDWLPPNDDPLIAPLYIVSRSLFL